MMSELERRSIRQADSAGGTLQGYAAVFRSPSAPLPSHRGDFIETIEPGAFARSLRESRVWAYYQHNDEWPLGRSPDTLQVREDRVGLAFRLELPDTTQGRDVRTLLEAGVLDGSMSFGFRTVKDRWEKRDGQLHRTLLDVDLHEISVVQIPAYDATSSGLRGSDLETARKRLMFRMNCRRTAMA